MTISFPKKIWISTIRVKKKALCVLLCTALCTFCVLLSSSSYSMTLLDYEQRNSFDFSITNTTILLWHWPFRRSYSLGENVCLEQYGYRGCLLVDNQSMLSGADLVVFHNRELASGQQRLPLNISRPPGQKWIWMSLESPENNGNLTGLEGHFSYVMTYRRDADIPIPYGILVPKEASNDSTVGGYLVSMNKTHQACWVVSNYSKRHKRSAVFSQLRKVINVKVYGKITKNPLDAESLLPTISRCYFYLAFENSISRDYITEKFWRNGLLGGAVPVVLGPPRENYEALAPKDSFIHVDDFNSIKELGEFLKNLIANKERYASYFAWKHRYSVKLYTDWRERLCSICPNLSKLRSQKIYHDIAAMKR
ncbi:alpha-(1,3)-fucosyltransferase 7-like isoform X2 [Sardina pilchardus]